MTVKTTPAEMEVRLAQLSLDVTQTPRAVQVTVSITNPKTHLTCWHKVTTNSLSRRAQQALADLTEAIEEDVAESLGGLERVTTTTQSENKPRGLGERLRGEDGPQM